jgi:hypothetical protein
MLLRVPTQSCTREEERMSPTGLLLNEVVVRWSDLSVSAVAATNGAKDRLVELLRATYGFSQSCVEREIDVVLIEFAARLHRAVSA